MKLQSQVKWSEMTAGVPCKWFAVWMNLHLSALKLIQLLTYSSLGGEEDAQTNN